MEGTETVEAETAVNNGATAGKKPKVAKSQASKVKINLTSPEEHPLTSFLSETKKRGVKNFDINEFFIEALDQVPSQWWQDKIDSLTPLEYKISAALANPEMREKLTDLLTSEQLKMDEALHS